MTEVLVKIMRDKGLNDLYYVENVDGLKVKEIEKLIVEINNNTPKLQIESKWSMQKRYIRVIDQNSDPVTLPEQVWEELYLTFAKETFNPNTWTAQSYTVKMQSFGSIYNYKFVEIGDNKILIVQFFDCCPPEYEIIQTESLDTKSLAGWSGNRDLTIKNCMIVSLEKLMYYAKAIKHEIRPKYYEKTELTRVKGSGKMLQKDLK